MTGTIRGTVPGTDAGPTYKLSNLHLCAVQVGKQTLLTQRARSRRVHAIGGTYELTAFRCPDCRHDQIDDRDGHTWDLDESDYSEDGSWER
jgi:hypothetical protein